MKWIRSRAAVLCLMALLGASASACSPYDLQDLLQEEPENIESESVKDSQNQQKAEAPAADTWQLEKPQREQISVGKYAYEHLDQQGQVIYDEMLTAILNHEEKIRLSTTDLDLMRKAYTAVCGDYGGLFWVEGYVFTRYTKGEELVSLEFAPKYTMSEEERKITQAQIDETVDLWMNGISINDTDYEKAKYVYELLALNTEYVPDATDSQNIISVFIKQQTVCQGYACATQYLLAELGIECAVITGEAEGEAHAWNLAKLDGDYYYIDTTWGNSTYTNKESGVSRFINYNYFGVTTWDLMQTHRPNDYFVLPECTATDDNYYIREEKYFSEWNPDAVGNLYREAYETGNSAVSVRFATKELYERYRSWFIGEKHIADYCSGISTLYYVEDRTQNVLTFSFS